MPFSLKVPFDSPLHKKLLARIASRIKMGEQQRSARTDKWSSAEDRVLAYLPETAVDAARRTDRTGGKPRYTTIQIPYTYAMLMSAHTYWTSTFFARSPIHQYNGLHGETEQQTQAVEALLSYQTDVGGFLGPYYLHFYDGGKYGLGILGEYWDKEMIQYGQLAEFETPDGKTELYQATMEVAGYEGNCLYNVSPFDFISDPRFPVSGYQKGEFCGAIRRIGWNEILSRQKAGYYNKSNVEKLKEHLTNRQATASSSNLSRPTPAMNYLYDDDDSKEANKHPGWAVVWEFYVKLIPSEWGVGTTNMPQMWCFTITEDLGLILGATPLGLMHGKFPFSLLETEIEAYGQHSRGIPEIMESVQNTMDWLINTHFFNVRASLNNQFLIDPSKVVLKDAQRGGPGFIWRLRPEAFGTDLDKIFKQIPVQDVTRMHMTDLNSMVDIGEKVLGVNEQMMGGLAQGGRRTATEVRTSTGFGVNRQKTIAEYISATAFGPHAIRLLQNSQQLYTAQKKLRIVGDLANEAGLGFINVTPETIAGFYGFVPVDGHLPIDRMSQANLWKEMLSSLRFMPPQVAASYDFGRIFAWVSTLAGLKNINRFKVQVVPDEQAAVQAGRGNVVPFAPPVPTSGTGIAAGGSASTETGLDAMQPEGTSDAY